jgi:hypothetical protein
MEAKLLSPLRIVEEAFNVQGADVKLQCGHAGQLMRGYEIDSMWQQMCERYPPKAPNGLGPLGGGDAACRLFDPQMKES